MAFKRPVGNILVPYGTPYHVTELFLQILKITFAELPDNHPYKYIADDFEKSGIAFDVALNKESEIYGRKPLVVVSRGAQSANITSVGDLAALNLPNNAKSGSNVASGAVNVSILSKSKAESEIVGQYIFGLVMMCRTHMPRLLGIHMVHSVTLSETSRYEDDDAMFLTQLFFQYQTQYKWDQLHTEPILRSVHIGVQNFLSGNGQPKYQR